MLELAITEAMIAAAQLASDEMGKLRNSITSGEGNLAGFIGEIMVAQHIGAFRTNTYDYDLVLGDIKIDVKTKRTTATPRAHYDCSVANFNTKQACDWYVFTRVLNDNTKGWILGYLTKEEFYKMARFHRAGEIDTSNNFTFKADCYNIGISELRALEKPAPACSQKQNDRTQNGYDWLYNLRGTK